MRDISARELKGHNILARDISARELKGHNILAVERFRDNTRWMIEFSVLRPGSYGSPGESKSKSAPM